MSTRAMNWALEAGQAARLNTCERLVLMLLAHHHHDKTGACWPAVATLADKSGLTERSVQMQLRKLEARGLITVTTRTVHGRQTSNQYDLFGKPGGAASVTPKPKRRGEPSFTPEQPARGERGGTPQDGRGVNPRSPNREYIPMGDDQTADVIRFTGSVARR